MKSRTQLQLKHLSRRRAAKAGFLLLAGGLAPGAVHAIGPANRVADRQRRGIVRRKNLRYRAVRATAKQKQEALAKAQRAQVRMKNDWVKTPQAKVYAAQNNLPTKGFAATKALKAAPVGMGKVVSDMKAPPVQAVKVSKAPGAQLNQAVVPVDLRTGGLVGNNVVEMARVPAPGKAISSQDVRAAMNEAATEGDLSTFSRRDVIVAKL